MHRFDQLVDSESGELTMSGDNLNIGTILSELSFILEFSVIFVAELGETVFTGNDDLLSTGELELASSEGFDSMGNVLFNKSDGVEDLVDLNSGDFTDGLTESTSHTGLESISTGAGKHFVNSDNVPRVDSTSQMETFFTAFLDQVLVGSNTASFHGFGGDLFLFKGDKMNGIREFFNLSSLLAGIVNSDSGIGDTSVITRLGEWLTTPVSVASSGSSSH